MISTLILKNQHSNIYELLQSIKDNIEPKSKLKVQVPEMIKKIELLNNTYFRHIEMEDIFLYPELFKTNIEHTDILCSNINDIRVISEELLSYINRYNSKNKILRNYNDFKNDTLLICSKINSKLKEEEINIYTLFNE